MRSRGEPSRSRDYWRARAQHRSVPIPDLIIAATAERYSLTVLHYDAGRVHPEQGVGEMQFGPEQRQGGPERIQPERVGGQRRVAQQRRLGYPGPHPGARSLRRGRAGSLGVILGERLTYAFDDPQATRFLAGVADVCAAEGVGLTLVPITGAASDVRRVAEAVVDGFVVWTTSDDDPVLDAVAGIRRPAVMHGGPSRRGLPVVGIDDRAAAAAVGRLAFTGAARPVVLSFPVNRNRAQALCTGAPGPAVTYPVTRHRWEGFLDAWRQAGGAPADLRVAVARPTLQRTAKPSPKSCSEVTTRPTRSPP